MVVIVQFVTDFRNSISTGLGKIVALGMLVLDRNTRGAGLRVCLKCTNESTPVARFRFRCVILRNYYK